MTPSTFRAIRKRAGLTQVQLAEHLHLPVQSSRKWERCRTIEDWEANRRTIPGPVSKLMEQLSASFDPFSRS